MRVNVRGHLALGQNLVALGRGRSRVLSLDERFREEASVLYFDLRDRSETPLLFAFLVTVESKHPTSDATSSSNQ